MRSIHVTASREYDVLIERGLLERAGEEIARVLPKARRAVIVCGERVPKLYAERLAASLRRAGVEPAEFCYPGGEQCKTLETYGTLLRFAAAEKLSRSDVIVALGGGVTGDLVGFAAATYQRGIPFVQIPTTLLAAVDSSIGGKTAIDLGETKNIVGAFWQPKVVLVDFDTLKTLPRRQIVNGLAEALKTGIIGDPQLFALFECEHPEENIEQIVYRSLKFKKKIVEQDEREGSVRACLNFGHTIGHGIEAVRGVRGRRTTGLYHGECVALGMLPMIEDNALLKRTRAIYRTLGLPTRTGANKEKVLAYMQHDKKARGDSITIIKCPGLGCWRADKLPMTELPTFLGID